MLIARSVQQLPPSSCKSATAFRVCWAGGWQLCSLHYPHMSWLLSSKLVPNFCLELSCCQWAPRAHVLASAFPGPCAPKRGLHGGVELPATAVISQPQIWNGVTPEGSPGAPGWHCFFPSQRLPAVMLETRLLLACLLCRSFRGMLEVAVAG